MMRKYRGFTLIELLVVVAIIALLIAILLPSLSRAREQGKATMCLSNQHTLGLAFVSYANDFDDWVVSSWTRVNNDPTSGMWWNPNSWVDWPKWPDGHYLNTTELKAATDVEAHKRGVRDGKLFPYVVKESIYHCPSDRRNTRAQDHNGAIAWVTYSMPNCLNGSQSDEVSIYGEDPNKNPKARRITTQTSVIPSASEKIAFLEESDPRGLNMNSWIMWLNSQAWIDVLTVWHNGRSTLGYADGHSAIRRWVDPRTLRMSEMQQLDTSAVDNQDYDFMKRSWVLTP